MKLPKRINQLLFKIGITEAEFFVGSKKEWIISILILATPILFLLALLIMIAFKFHGVVWSKVTELF